MPRYRFIQNNFLNGEISPKAYGRTDLKEYKEGAEEITNAIVYPQGGASRRVGTEFARQSQYDDIRLFPFVFAKTEPYLVEVNADSTDKATMTITNLTSGIITQATISDSSISTGDNQYEWAGYAAADLAEVQYAQSGDVLFFVHQDYPPIYLARTAENTFILNHHYNDNTSAGAAPASGNQTWSFRDQNATATTMTLNVVTVGTGRSLTSSAAYFEDDMVGGVWGIADGGVDGYFIITGVSSSTAATVEIIEACPAGATGGLTTWNEGSWSTYRGFPRSVAFFQQRLCYGGNQSQPDTLWTSETGDVFQLTQADVEVVGGGTLTNVSPTKFSIASNEVNQIQWLSPGSALNVGTLGREFIVSGPDNTTAFGALNISATPETAHGSAHVQAVRQQNVVLFVQRSEQKLREFVFNRDENSYTSNDISYLAEHMAKKGIDLRSDFNNGAVISLALQEADNGILWMLDNNGYLFGVTRDRRIGITAFHFQKFGGEFNSEEPFVTSFAIIPSVAGTHDDIWISLKRTIDGTDVTYIEKMGKEFIEPNLNSTSTNIEDQPTYSDSCTLSKPRTGVGFFASWTTALDDDADYALGSVAGTATGSDVVVGGGQLKLSESGVAVNYVDFDGTTSADFCGTGPFTVSFDIEFYYSGDPAANKTIFYMSEGSSDTDHEFSLIHQTNGRLRVDSRNNSGGDYENDTSAIDFSPIAGYKYNFELSVDQFDEPLRLWINGKEFQSEGSNPPQYAFAQTRNNFAGVWAFMRLGSNAAGTDTSHFALDNFSISNEVRGSGTSPVVNDSDFTVGPFSRDDDTTVYGLDHLEGETIQVLDNGIARDDKTVADGQITLDSNPTCLVMGLQYITTVSTLALEAGSAVGSAQGAISRIDQSTLRFYRTVGAKIGGTGGSDTLDDVIFRTVDIDEDDPIPLFTGDKRIMFPKGYERGAKVKVTQELPLPMTLSAIVSRGLEYD